MNGIKKNTVASYENTNKRTRSNWGQVMEDFLEELMLLFMLKW
jgi:hypothetical protein